MAVDDYEQQTEAIANEWGVDPQLLEDAQYEVESNDTSDGVTVSYFIRFSRDTDRELLNQLGVAPGEFYREVSVNAFDEGDGAYSIDEPLPDISRFIPDDFELPEPPVRNPTGRRAYFIDDERYTPSQFRRLSRARKIEAMVQWFHENYEDPAENMPHVSQEGGYQWIWGGPYDAREQIGDQFADVAGDDIIEAAVREVEKDGLVDWAPKSSPDDPEPIDESPHTAATSNFGNSNFSNFRFAESQTQGSGQARSVETLRLEMLARFDVLEGLIRQQTTFSPKRWHNNPPEMLPAEPPVTQEQLAEVQKAIADIRQEAAAVSPSAEVVIQKASILRRFGVWLAGVLGGAVVSEILTKGFDHRQVLINAAIDAANAAIAWAQHLPPPF